MTRIGCHHFEGGQTSPLTQIGRATDGTLVATYSDGARIAIAATGGDPATRRVPVLEFDLYDEPFVHFVSGTMTTETPAEEVEQAFGAWLATAVCAVDMQGHAFRIHALEKAGMVLRDSDGDMDTFPHMEDGRPLCAVWIGDHLIGFAYGSGTPIARSNGTFIGAEIDRVRRRLAIIPSRLKGEWRIVAGEGERLGTETSDVRAGCHVKVGLQPIHPMPNDFRAEWLWAKVTKVKDGRVTATLANDPCTFHCAVSFGDTVRFDLRDIYAVDPAPAKPA